MKCAEIRIATYISCFVTLVWMSSLIYYLLALVLDVQLHKHKMLHGFRVDANTFDLMKDIGFSDNPNLYPQAYHDDNIPVFVMTLEFWQYKEFIPFLRSMKMYYSDKKFVIFNINLTPEQLEVVCIIYDSKNSKINQAT